MKLITDDLELDLKATPEGWTADTSTADHFILLHGPKGHEIMVTFGFLPGCDVQILIVYHTPDGEAGLFYTYKVIEARNIYGWPTKEMADWCNAALNHLIGETPVEPKIGF